MREALNAHSPQVYLDISIKGAAAVEVAAVGLTVFVTVALGCADGVPDAVAFVEFSCSNGTMTASSTCMRPLCVLFRPCQFCREL